MKTTALSLFSLSLLAPLVHAAPKSAWPANIPGKWTTYERAVVETKPKSVVVTNGFIANDQSLADAEISFSLRAPAGVAQVQAWAGFRVKDEDNRYLVGLRGGNNNHIYLVRNAPEARAALLGIAPLEKVPQPGEWYQLRVVTMGKRILVFLGDEALPRINVEDTGAMWGEGAVALGGGYLPAEYADLKVAALDDAARARYAELKDKKIASEPVDKASVRAKQRAGYRPAVVEKLNADRTEVSLNGQWLFLPDQELSGTGVVPTGEVDDQSWHVLEVPALWTPTLAWLHGEELYRELKGVAGRKAVSDKAYLDEIKRVESFSFDWEKTKGGWYRHHLQLPAGVESKRLELVFDAIAQVSEVYVNGAKVGSHVGMFGDVRCDISSAVKPGANVIAVHVQRNSSKQPKKANKTIGIAESVEVTDEMLRSLPKGMYGFEPGGIWQPVNLEVTEPVAVKDVYIKPRLDSAELELEVVNTTAGEANVTVGYTIRSKQDGSVLVSKADALVEAFPAKATKVVKLETAKAAPKLWSPHDPNLYELEITLSLEGKVADRTKTSFGFRTFVVDGNRFLLNGKPYWMRGANHFPIPLKPNDAALAEKFITLAKEGNVETTRTHVAPLTTTWADAADRLGLLISFEGIWPWLMLKGDIPPKELLDVWQDNFSAMIRKYRNRPSVVLWTVNNEMKFYVFERKNFDILKSKWAVVSDMIKKMRQLDPTRPIVADSGYIRGGENKEAYEKVIVPNGFDDGDVDDAHRYYCWYNPSFTTLYNGEYGKLSTPDRPLISQEMSTGYPRNDDGLPTRSYLFMHYTPQTLVGKYAYEHNNPEYFLKRQAFNTRQLAEVIRRSNHAETAGVLHFAYLTWFKNCFDAKTIEPFPTYDQLKQALNPVLISAELFGWHYFAGAKIKPRVCVVNDARDAAALPAGELQWEIVSGKRVLSKGTQPFKGLPHYNTLWSEVEIAMPGKLPAGRAEANLVFKLVADGKVLSENSYELTIADRAWTKPAKALKSIAVYDPKQKLPADLGLKAIASLKGLPAGTPVVVAPEALEPGDVDSLKQFVESGGQVLLLNPGKLLTQFSPAIKEFRSVKDGEIVSFNRPGSPAFKGLEPLDLAWFHHGPGVRPVACTGIYNVDRTLGGAEVLAEFCAIHGYLEKKDDIYKHLGAPLVQLKLGKGIVVASEMALGTNEDPIAGKLLTNLVQMIATPTKPNASKK